MASGPPGSNVMATKRKPAKRKAKTPRRPRRKSSAPPPEPHIKREPIDPKDVQLVRGKGTEKSGGGPGGHYWHIETGDKRAGNIFINIIECELYGEHPSVQIHLNKDQRGKQIGRVAYRLAWKRVGIIRSTLTCANPTLPRAGPQRRLALKHSTTSEFN